MEKTPLYQMVYAFLDSLAQGQTFPLASDNHNYFPSLKNGTHAHGQGHTWNFVQITSKEPRVGKDGVVCESLDPCPACEGGARLVERDVTVFTDTTQEELDSAMSLDRGFVSCTFCNEIWCISIKDVDVLGLDIDYMYCQTVAHNSTMKIDCSLCEKNSRNMKVW